MNPDAPLVAGDDQPGGAFDPRSLLRQLSGRPGVYRMLDDHGKVLYVGKAKDLKRRVSSYFTRSLNTRIQSMVAQIRDIEVTVTQTEAEALILENNLIKSLRPRYNILLRDDKSYPYIYLSGGPFPRLSFHRGSRKAPGHYFGPYPSASAVRQTLQLLQKLFPVRQCEDSFFQNRARPCLQYQIERCTAPCVGLVTEADYARDVEDTVLFLDGRTNQVAQGLVRRMDEASARLEFEQAARLRDQISALQQVQERQYVSGEGGDLDIVACAVRAGQACVQVFFVRGGRNLGNKVFFPRAPEEAEPAGVVSAFVAQHYLGAPVPGEILTSHQPADADLLETVLADQVGRRVQIRSRVRGERARWVRMAEQNARIALESRLASRSGMQERLEALQVALGLAEPPQRMECFDISHTGGELPVASCVVFDTDGPASGEYRRFNIRGVTEGDDYGAMEQALGRRYRRLVDGEGVLPDLLFIDGGKGQLNAAWRVLEELGVGSVMLVGVAKGASRKPGLERLFLLDREAPIILPADSPALHLVQQIRDEAHRFAITGHRRRRDQSRKTSPLEQVPGVGPRRRQRLLRHFGGLQGIARAGKEDLARVDGISPRLAEQIYDAFHGEG
jgi:excinuclease ABC subunit C